ncbi:response regulator transcription factor [Kribbella sp. CA-293567]|uniref:response regulator transcription factor n=1 Tax=Kribbella sp. CA-293567 TaxID=3002436 RepID=UPI0022DDB3D2|nr:response regulator transcription factor [Kribbella sp. CA-293567]WBQ06232.1 response regulator transcription factor [Kribbella sp. CA-293567]
MIRLLLADDENLIRTALAALLSLEDDLEVVGQAASADEALAMARRHRPDVAVLDLQMPGVTGSSSIGGIGVVEALRTELPFCSCLIVTGHGRPGHLKQALAAGVRGFLPKTVSAQVLAEVIRTIHTGGRYVDPELAAEAISAGDNPLTPREAEVLEHAADGAPIDQVARRASLSPGTVRNYLSSAAGKLGTANRYESVQVARTHGWI